MGGGIVEVWWGYLRVNLGAKWSQHVELGDIVEHITESERTYLRISWYIIDNTPRWEGEYFSFKFNPRFLGGSMQSFHYKFYKIKKGMILSYFDCFK